MSWEKRVTMYKDGSGPGGGGGGNGGDDVKGDAPEAMEVESDDSAWESGDDSAHGKGERLRQRTLRIVDTVCCV